MVWISGFSSFKPVESRISTSGSCFIEEFRTRFQASTPGFWDPFKGPWGITLAHRRAILGLDWGNLLRGTTLRVQPRNPRLEGFRVQLCGGIGSTIPEGPCTQ